MLTLEHFILAFIPIFVAVDPIGILPVFVSLTHGVGQKQKRRIIFLSLLTAVCLAIGFIFLGKAIFRTLGITVGDFMIAGGAIFLGLRRGKNTYPINASRIPGRGADSTNPSRGKLKCGVRFGLSKLMLSFSVR